MARVLWTPVAQSELEDILFYIRVADGRPITARRIGEQLLAEIARYAASPGIGARLPMAPEGWLYLKFKRWLIFYQRMSDGIEIMRVIDAVRDLPGQFKE